MGSIDTNSAKKKFFVIENVFQKENTKIAVFLLINEF